MIRVIGFGAWGGALSIHLAHYGIRDIIAWEYLERTRRAIETTGVHPALAGQGRCPKSIRVTGEIEALRIGPRNLLILAVAGDFFSSTLERIKFQPRPLAFLILSKGLDPKTLLPLSQNARRILGLSKNDIFALSGPTIAKELLQGSPTLAVLAGPANAKRRQIQKILSRGNLRIQTSEDIIGVQIGGAMKNIYGLGYGILEGLGAPANARAIFLCRAMDEITRMSERLGGQKETAWGPAGLGDLLTTSLSPNSRNSGLGRILAKGCSLEEGRRRIGMVTEGVEACRQFNRLAAKQKIRLPLLHQIQTILNTPSKSRELLLRLK